MSELITKINYWNEWWNRNEQNNWKRWNFWENFEGHQEDQGKVGWVDQVHQENKDIVGMMVCQDYLDHQDRKVTKERRVNEVILGLERMAYQEHQESGYQELMVNVDYQDTQVYQDQLDLQDTVTIVVPMTRLITLIWQTI